MSMMIFRARVRELPSFRQQANRQTDVQRQLIAIRQRRPLSIPDQREIHRLKEELNTLARANATFLN
jgi:hypothetical protein